MKQFAYTKI